MPFRRDLLRTAGRPPIRRLAPVILMLAAKPALADHGLPPLASGGVGWTTWLVVAGAVVAVGLAAWAFFAPARPEEDPAATGVPDARPPENRSR
jgi:hypothetical protein